MSITGSNVDKASISFEHASRLQKVNQILEQEIEYFSANPKLLAMEGVLRVQGEENIAKPIFEKMMADPSKVKISSINEFKLEPHNAIGVLKKAVKDPLEISDDNKKIIYEFLNKNSKMTVEQCMTSLFANKSIEEAKLFYNLLHLGYLVALNKDSNKMTPSNVAVVLAPWFANIMDNPMLGFDPDLKVAITRVLENTPTLSQSFRTAYPEKEKELQDEYAKGFKAPPAPVKASEKISLPETKPASGNIFTRFFRAIWNGIKRLFGSNPQDREILISKPTQFKKLDNIEISGEADKKELPSHHGKRKKAVAHRHHHHRKETEEKELLLKDDTFISELKNKQKVKTQPKKKTK